MSKKKAKRPLPQTADKILNLWIAAAKEGLGGKRFHKRIGKEFGPKLRRSIRDRLKQGPFGPADAKNTRQLAKLLGRICKISTDKQEVDVDTFEKAFLLVKDHPRCPPTGAGRGEWCSIT